MKPLFKYIVLAGLAGALLAPVAFAGPQGPQQVYTWVDKNGVRHYSDTPHNPNAVLITVDAPAAGSAGPAATAAPPAGTATAGPVGKPQKVPVRKPHETPAQRKARCDKLRREVKQLQSARRVKVTENGQSRFYSGDNLVKFRQRLAQRMQAACKPPSE